MIVTVLLWVLLVHESVAQELVGNDNFDADHEDDIKELFFRRVRAYEEGNEDVDSPSDYFVDIPQPGGFKVYEQRNKRLRRDTNDINKTESNYKIIGQIQADIAKHIAQPTLSLDEPTDIRNHTPSETNVQTELTAEPEKEGGLVGINDFIRFRRGLEHGVPILKKDDQLKNAQERVESVIVKHAGEFADLRPYSEKHDERQRAGKMLMQEENVVPEGSREPRGATKEQWVKQPYPVSVSVDDNNYDDNIPSPTDIRAPRVHFVTQRRLESAPPPVYKNFERESRSRDFRDSPREPRRSTSRSPTTKLDREYYPLERPLKNLEPYPPRPYNPYRDDPYYRYEESRYDPRYGHAEHDRDRPEFTSRQRRIIYYATLPEVVRTPPNVNLRDRYSYRDRYDDRYVTSPSLSVAEGGSYRFRKPYPFTKPRYDHENERTKAPYPLKVSTDVNVRETKKNPERRIYSEPDRRYAYKTPAYQPEESFDHRT